VAYLKSHGITVLGEPITMTAGDTGGETWVHFRAPWGAEMELVSYPKGKAYEGRYRAAPGNPSRPARWWTPKTTKPALPALSFLLSKGSVAPLPPQAAGQPCRRRPAAA
jgi:hypothetical protein